MHNTSAPCLLHISTKLEGSPQTLKIFQITDTKKKLKLNKVISCVTCLLSHVTNVNNHCHRCMIKKTTGYIHEFNLPCIQTKDTLNIGLQWLHNFDRRRSKCTVHKMMINDWDFPPPWPSLLFPFVHLCWFCIMPSSEQVWINTFCLEDFECYLWFGRVPSRKLWLDIFILVGKICIYFYLCMPYPQQFTLLVSS